MGWVFEAVAVLIGIALLTFSINRLVRALQTGVMRLARSGSVLVFTRATEPVAFWFVWGLYAALAAILLIAGAMIIGPQILGSAHH